VSVLESATSVTGAVASYTCSQAVADAAQLFGRARWAVIDTIAVAIAARNEPTFTILAKTVGVGGEVGESIVLTTRTRTTARQAALLNGTAGHALDYDDMSDEMGGHPSVVLVPALLAVAEAVRSTGREFLEAYVVGFDVACAVASGLPVGLHYERGWHPTATVGILGAVAGASRLLHLDESHTRRALGIAGSMASGSRQNFGTMTKPLHAGLAARDAVLAAQLAANGFSADEAHLESPLGYLQLYGVKPDVGAVLTSLTSGHILLTKGVSVKKYPCCYNTHRLADAALTLYRNGIRGSHVRSVAVTVQPGNMMPLVHHRPRSGLQGKFSAEYVVAAALLDGAITLSTFSDDAVLRPECQSLLERVEVKELSKPPVGSQSYDLAYAAVEVTLVDGSIVSQRCDIPIGDARLPLDDAALQAKFQDCLKFANSNWDALDLLGRLLALGEAERISDVLDTAGIRQ
jgi:2-methylcitrate dehydratase PrpD